MRRLVFVLVGLSACTTPPPLPSPQVNGPALASADSAVSSEVKPESPVVLLREGEVLFDRQPPPFPDTARADSIREVYRKGDHATARIVTEAYALDSLGQEIAASTVLREAARSIPDSARAFVQVAVAWDGTVFRADVVRVVGAVPAGVVRDALTRIYFRPTWFDSMGPDVPRGTPIPFSTRFSLPFSRSWLD